MLTCMYVAQDTEEGIRRSRAGHARKVMAQPRVVKADQQPRGATHVYLVVYCKTPNCESFYALKYIGEKGNIPTHVPVSIPSPLLIRCPTCTLTHDFSSSDLREIEQTEAPPADFRDTI